MQIDEIRFEEDLPALGLNWIKLGLEDVLYDPKNNTVYTPNTNQTAEMGKLQLGGARETEETPLQERANPYHNPANGQFTSGPGGAASAGNSGLTQGTAGGTLQSSTKPTWTKAEQKKPFDYYELQPDKTGYPRHLKAQSFSSEERLQKHFSDHGKSVGATDAADYVARAKAFFDSPRGKSGDAHVKKNGDACRYDYDTHELMIVTKSGIIKSYWNLLDGKSPSGADSYWQNQKKE